MSAMELMEAGRGRSEKPTEFILAAGLLMDPEVMFEMSPERMLSCRIMYECSR